MHQRERLIDATIDPIVEQFADDSTRSAEDRRLIRAFISSFVRLGELIDTSGEVPPELTIGVSQEGWRSWRPIRIATPRSALEAFYGELGLPPYGSTRLPPLYEHLILSYRWAEVDLGTFRLMDHLPGSDLQQLAQTVKEDVGLWATLVPNGYIRFGKGPDLDYDPVCFDFRHRRADGDCRIVKLDHEAILCDFRIQEVAEPAPSFRALLSETIERATRRRPAGSTSTDDAAPP